MRVQHKRFVPANNFQIQKFKLRTTSLTSVLLLSVIERSHRKRPHVSAYMAFNEVHRSVTTGIIL